MSDLCVTLAGIVEPPIGWVSDEKQFEAGRLNVILVKHPFYITNIFDHFETSALVKIITGFVPGYLCPSMCNHYSRLDNRKNISLKTHLQ